MTPESFDDCDDDADLGGEAPCWAHFVEDLDQRDPDTDDPDDSATSRG